MSLSFQMTNLVVLVLLLFPGPNLAIESYQNVVFSEQNEISLTQARWPVTFSIDLTPYEATFQLLKEYIKMSNQVQRKTSHKNSLEMLPLKL